jgi:hypothetical protein
MKTLPLLESESELALRAFFEAMAPYVEDGRVS